jgi:SNF2-related domain
MFSNPSLFLNRLFFFHLQEEELAFMIDVESGQVGQSWLSTYNPSDPATHQPITIRTRGGWLSSEAGMGKSAVVIALIVSHPMRTDHPKKVGNRELLKGTFIMTSASCLGHWEDECKKHAPHLKVSRFHGMKTNKQRRDAVDLIYESDVIISTATMKWNSIGTVMDEVLFHRVVMDECHIFSQTRLSADPDKAKQVPSGYRWCVSATPLFRNPHEELRDQMNFMNMPRLSYRTFNEGIALMKQHMIRHTRGQGLITLPTSSTKFVLVGMSKDEQAAYEEAISTRRKMMIKYMKDRQEGKNWYYLQHTVARMLAEPLAAPCSVREQIWFKKIKLRVFLEILQKLSSFLRLLYFD